MIKQTKYKGYYADENGNIYSNISGSMKILKQMNHSDGYRVVTIGQKKIRVHRIVAETFLDNSLHKPCVDHINTNKADNRVVNLRWCTYRENSHNELTVAKMKQILNSPEYKEKMKVVFNSFEYKAKRKAVFNDPEYKIRQQKRRFENAIAKLLMDGEQEQYINVRYILPGEYYVDFRQTKEYREKMSKAKTGKIVLKKRKYDYDAIKEFLKLKEQMSWRELGIKTGIPVRALRRIFDSVRAEGAK